MSDVIRLCAAGAVEEGSPLRVESQGSFPLVVFRIRNRYFVAPDKCTHGAGVLSEGSQDGALIECPLHGGVFDITNGQPVRFPCRMPLHVIEAVETDGWVCISRWPSP